MNGNGMNGIFLWRLPIQNHLKLCIPEKRLDKAKYLIQDSIFKFVKKTSMASSVKSLEYIKCCSLNSLRSIKNSSNSIKYKFRKICSLHKKVEDHNFLKSPLEYN